MPVAVVLSVGTRTGLAAVLVIVAVGIVFALVNVRGRR
jgi:hypothetical protein